MKKQFIKLCLASILSLSLNTDLQAQKITLPIHATQEIAITEDTFSEINSFIQRVQTSQPDIEVNFSPEGNSLTFSNPRNSHIREISDVLQYLESQDWTCSLKSLSICGTTYDIDTLVDTLSTMSHLEELHLNNLIFKDDELRALIFGLNEMPNLRTLDLKNSKITNDAIIELSDNIDDSLNIISQLHTLDLSNNKLGTMNEEGLQALCKFLSCLPNLSTLNLNYNTLSEKAFEILAPAISTRPYLHTLDLGYNHINKFTIDTHSQTIFPRLKMLNLGNNQLGKMDEEGIQFLNSFLSLLPNLQTLNLAENHLGEKLEILAPAIAQMQNLQKLSLSSNEIGESAIINFVDALFYTGNFHDLRSLENLDLYNNQLGELEEDGAHTLAALLSRTPNLQKLDLGSNKLGKSALIYLTKTLCKIKNFTMPNLQTLDLSDNELGFLAIINSSTAFSQTEDYFTLGASEFDDKTMTGNSGLQAFATFLSFMPELQKLILVDNEINGNTITAFKEIISQMKDFKIPALRTLDLGGANLDEMDSTAWQNLADMLLALPNLKSLNLNYAITELSDSFLNDFLLRLHVIYQSQVGCCNRYADWNTTECPDTEDEYDEWPNIETEYNSGINVTFK